MEQIVVNKSGAITYAISRLVLQVAESAVEVQIVTRLDGIPIRIQVVTLPSTVVDPALAGTASGDKTRLQDLADLLYGALIQLGYIAGEIQT